MTQAEGSAPGRVVGAVVGTVTGPVPGPPPGRLAEHTTIRLGGPARRLVEARDEAALLDAVRACDAGGDPLLVVGGGSNLLVADEGFDGTALLVATRGVRAEPGPGDAVLLTVAAGEPWDGVVARAVGAGLSGLEALSGIPGSAGATPVQNVGAYGQEVSGLVVAVRAWDRRAGAVAELRPADLAFGYRHSALKGDPGRFVVLDVTFRLTRRPDSAPVRYAQLAERLGVGVGDRAPLGRVREAVLALRAGKGMVLDPADHDTWSCGSFFTNPVLDAEAALALPDGAPRFAMPAGRVKTSAAWLIEHAGYTRGFGVHGPGSAATLSTCHTLALTNRGGAVTADVVELAREVRDGVRRAFGVVLVPEPTLVGVEI